MDATATGPLPGTPNNVEITFDNRGDRLIGLGLVNGLLKILSLGIYSFWGKTEVRKRLWSFTRLNGEPLEYTGTGKELFLGFLVVFALFVLPLMLAGLAIALVFPNNKAAIAAYQVGAYGLFFVLLGNAIYRAQRYRLSRTQWRGIRGGLVGSPGHYGWTYLWTLALPFGLVALLAGAASVASPAAGAAVGLIGFIAALWVLPWRSNKLQGLITNDMRFGDRALTYTGSSRPLYKRYFFAWAGSALAYLAALVATAFLAWTPGLQAALQNADMDVADGMDAADAPVDPSQMPDLSQLPGLPSAGQFLAIAAIWILTFIVLGLITAWYRANQLNHFANHTHIDDANFRLSTSGKGIMWLLFSNWMISVLGIVLGIIAGGALAYFGGFLPEPPVAGAQPHEPSALFSVAIALPIILLTTLAGTFAQFRSARYFLSRLKLDGGVDLSAIQQSSSALPKRGEGLAQVFDIDAF